MAKQTNLFLTSKINLSAQTFVNADGTTIKVLATAGSDDSNIVGLSICNTVATAHTLLLYLYDGTTNFAIGHISIPASAGTNGTVARVNGLSAVTLPGLRLDAAGNPYIQLEAGWSLHGALLAAIAASNTITVVVTAEDY